jgi:hypothetical protein
MKLTTCESCPYVELSSAGTPADAKYNDDRDYIGWCCRENPRSTAPLVSADMWCAQHPDFVFSRGAVVEIGGDLAGAMDKIDWETVRPDVPPSD